MRSQLSTSSVPEKSQGQESAPHRRFIRLRKLLAACFAIVWIFVFSFTGAFILLDVLILLYQGGIERLYQVMILWEGDYTPVHPLLSLCMGGIGIWLGWLGWMWGVVKCGLLNHDELAEMEYWSEGKGNRVK